MPEWSRLRERPVIGVEAVLALADAVAGTLPDSDLVGHIRFSRGGGELMGLRKSDIDLNEATVSIERSVAEIGRELVDQGAQRPQLVSGPSRCRGP